MKDWFTTDELDKVTKAFEHLKAEKDNFLLNNTSNAFVRTEFYNNAQVKGKCLLVGRKGSGKTALLYGHEDEHSSSYYDSDQIELDNLPFTELFNFFFEDFQKAKDEFEKHRGSGSSDTKSFIEPEKVSYYAWKNSIVSTCLIHTSTKLLKEDESNPFLNTEDRDLLKKSISKISSYVGLSIEDFISGDTKKIVLYPLLVYFFRSIQDAIEDAIDIDAPSFAILLAAIAQRVLTKLEDDLDIDLLSTAKVIKKILDSKSKLVLVTLDKFDDFYDKFYEQHGVSESDERKISSVWINDRKDFLQILLEGLVLAARDIKEYPELSWLDTLFTIPMDKFLELHLRERMDLEQQYLLFIEWTPPELYDFANRRIADALNIKGEKRKRAWYELFPSTIYNGSNNLPEDSFLYIARHTLWKPREIQMYVLSIVKTIKEKDGKALSNYELRKCVEETSKEIVRQEFKEEFSREYPGIKKVLQKLEHASIETVMEYSDFLSLIADIPLSNGFNSPEKTMTRLFYMGLIGVRHHRPNPVKGKNGTVTQGKRELAYCFHYNSLETNPFSDNNHVIIHPMFFDQLGVAHQEEYIINELKWDMFSDKANKKIQRTV